MYWSGIKGENYKELSKELTEEGIGYSVKLTCLYKVYAV